MCPNRERHFVLSHGGNKASGHALFFFFYLIIGHLNFQR